MSDESEAKRVVAELSDLAALLERANCIDLAPAIETGMPRWPSHPPIEVDPHAGAHVDAPVHIAAALSACSIDAMPVRKLMAPAKTFDLRAFGLQAGELATADMLASLDRWSAPLAKGEIALLNFGWSERYWRAGDGGRWYSENAPGLSKDACAWLADRGIVAAGSDTVGFDIALRDGVVVQPAYAHETYLLPRDINIIECLGNLDKVAERSYFIALPLKITGGSGAPLRPVALDFRPQRRSGSGDPLW